MKGEWIMKLKTISGIALAVLSIASIVLALNIYGTETFSATIVVPDDYDSMQDAIDAANPGDQIMVRNGTYHEWVIVNKTVSLFAEYEHGAIVDGLDVGTIFTVTADNVNITRFVIRKASPGHAIYLNNVSGSCIRDNILQNNNYGILLISSNNNITNNLIQSNAYHGIFIERTDPASTYNRIIANNITDNRDYGIYIRGYSGGPRPSDNVFFHNNLVDNWDGQVRLDYSGSNIWDDGYPSGGNYWSDYLTRYPDAKERDGSGIWDTPYIINIDNIDRFPLMRPYPSHDIAVTEITPSSTVVGQGFPISINVTVQNRGQFTETFNVTVYANTSEIQTQNIALTNGSSTIVTFTWNTATFAYGHYTIKAVADTVPGETFTADNTLVNGTVFVTIAGDIDGDGDVDYDDFIVLAGNYGKEIS